MHLPVGTLRHTTTFFALKSLEMGSPMASVGVKFILNSIPY